MERKRGLSWLKDRRVLVLCGGCIFAGFLLGMLIFGSPGTCHPPRAASRRGSVTKAINEKQTGVLELQAGELGAALAQRGRTHTCPGGPGNRLVVGGFGFARREVDSRTQERYRPADL
jgi:hypothetical protein